MRFKLHFLVCATLVLALSGCKDRGNPINPVKCQDARWSYLGLAGKPIEALRAHGGFLYAGTSAGVFRKLIYSADTAWVSLGLESRHIKALIVLDDLTFITSVLINVVENHNDTISLYKTTDAGKHWFPYQNGFGGGEGYYNQVTALDRLESDPETMIAVGGAVAKSTDEGMSWRRVFGDYWNVLDFVFIRINQNVPNEVWAGGNTFFFAPFLMKSHTFGESWQLLPLNIGFENTCVSIALHSVDQNIAYLGTQGAILKTTDGGMNWSVALAPSEPIAFFGLAVSRDSVVYAAGEQPTPDPQTLHFYRSSNGGISWDNIVQQNSKGAMGVKHLVVLADADVDYLLIGTLGGGVFSYANSITGFAQ